MDPQSLVEISREAAQAVLVLSAPVLIVALVVGLVIGALQAMTQIQDQTTLFVAKLLATVVVISLCMPWLLQQITEYSRNVIEEIPQTISERY